MIQEPAGLHASPHDGQTPLRWADLLALYDAYRERQGRLLLQMLPRDAVRPLYRLAMGARAASLASGSDDDPLAVLASFCESLLPLPSFEVWLADFYQNPDEHLRGIDETAFAPTAESPLTVEARSVELGGRAWAARLRSFRDGDSWRGFISFESAGTVHRTAVIFHESDPAEIRERFLSFQDHALAAFLRSSLP